MDIWATDKLTLFLAFVVPGFLSLKTYAVLGLQGPRDSSQQLIDAVAFSCINYALLAWPILVIEASGIRSSHPRSYYAFYGFCLLVAPVLWALIWRWLRTTQTLQKFLPHPTDKPWDYVFRRRLPYWMIVTFKDGRKVAGRYDSRSFSSAAPSPEQLFLEQAWEMNSDGGFERPRTDSAGLLVLGTEIATVELFHINPGVEHGNETNTKRAGEEGLAAQPIAKARD